MSLVVEHDPAKKPPIADVPNGTVQLFQFPRGPFAPSVSPFPLKVETYLRLAKIPYQNDLLARLSSRTGKIPWIRYNGEEVDDSTFILKYLAEKLGKDLNKGLTAEQKAVGLAFERLMDEHLYWILLYSCWVEDEGMKGIVKGLGDDDFVRGPLRDIMKSQCHNQGMSRHPKEKVHEFAVMGFQAISDYLGKKDFMMGSKPTQVDCTVFGLLAQFLWCVTDGYIGNIIADKFPSLERYCIRMKEKAWPDWDECITHDLTRKATK